MFSIGLAWAIEIGFVLGKAANPFHFLAALQTLVRYDRFFLALAVASVMIWSNEDLAASRPMMLVSLLNSY
jgi:hypothetical protein